MKHSWLKGYIGYVWRFFRRFSPFSRSFLMVKNVQGFIAVPPNIFFLERYLWNRSTIGYWRRFIVFLIQFLISKVYFTAITTYKKSLIIMHTILEFCLIKFCEHDTWKGEVFCVSMWYCSNQWRILMSFYFSLLVATD